MVLYYMVTVAVKGLNLIYINVLSIVILAFLGRLATLNEVV